MKAKPKLEKQATKDDLDLRKKLKEIFEIFDKDGSGEVSVDELNDVVVMAELPIEPDEVVELVKKADKDKSGQLNFEEFFKAIQVEMEAHGMSSKGLLALANFDSAIRPDRDPNFDPLAKRPPSPKLARPVFPGHRTGVRPLKKQDMELAILGTLLSHGLEQTAACLRKESPDVGDKEPAGEGIMAPLLQTDVEGKPVLHADAVKDMGRSGKAPKALLGHHENIAASAKRTDATSKRVGQVSGHLRAFREADWIPDDAGTEHDEDGDLRKELTELKKNNLGLRKDIKDRTDKEDEMRRHLKDLQDQIAQLREEAAAAEAAKAKAAPPPQPKLLGPQGTTNEQLAEAIREILKHWEDDHSPLHPKRTCSHCFAHVDANHDGRLDWNSHEMMKFACAVFVHYHLPAPKWPEPFWYGMYRTCDSDMSYSLDLHEAFGFAHYAFEVALRALTGGQEYHMEVQVAGGAAAQPQPLRQVAILQAPAADPRELIHRILAEWETPGALRKFGFEAFMHCDRNHDGLLEAVSQEHRAFVYELFQRYGVPVPQWNDEVWFKLYSNADLQHLVACDGSPSLGIDEALALATHCMELYVSEVDTGIHVEHLA